MWHSDSVGLGLRLTFLNDCNDKRPNLQLTSPNQSSFVLLLDYHGSIEINDGGRGRSADDVDVWGKTVGYTVVFNPSDVTCRVVPINLARLPNTPLHG